MKKLSVILCQCLITLTASAITQQGFVRTITRPNHPSERLEGVMIRIRGGHNTILSTPAGDFSIIMQSLRNGDPYVLSAVMKSGYQLADQDMIGRQQSGSDRVPLELTMISSAQLQKEKDAIAAKARTGIERFYMEQLSAIEKELSEQKLTNEQYEQRIAELDNKLMRSEQQIEQMADRYARTDYSLLDSVAGAIQAAMEQGNLDEAAHLILQKGDLQNRRNHIQEMRRDLAIQSEDLKRDYYHLHSIALARFEPDSAAHFLQLRADLDTTDAAAQLDYIKFLQEYLHNPHEVLPYIQRAERQIRLAGDEHCELMLRLLNEKNVYYGRIEKKDESLKIIEDAITLSIELYGRNHKYVAGRRVNMGKTLYQMGKLKEAEKQLKEALRIYNLPGQTDSITEARTLTNLGAVTFKKNNYRQARQYFEESVSILNQCSPNDPSLPTILDNLGYLCALMKEPEQSSRYRHEAYETAARIFGEKHTFTQKLKSKIYPK